MDVSTFLEQTRDPATRRSNYRETVRQYYDGVTMFYRHGWGECFHFAPFRGRETVTEAIEAQHRMLIAAAGIERQHRILDVGCGIGGPARSIARLTGAHVTGVTISPAQVKAARQLTRKRHLGALCEVVLGDAMKLAYGDKSFDVVLSIESACHMPDKAAFYAECARVLRPGGRLAGWDWILTPGRDVETARREHAEPICTYFALPTLSTLEEIGEHLRGAGLEVNRLEDLAADNPNRCWWEPLARRLESPISRVASRLSPTLSMMQTSGEILVRAARAGAFSALGFFVAEKPRHLS
jgi:sterol 24-C-methyltransferase